MELHSMLPLLTLLFLPSTQAHFFGPVAVGFGVGLVGVHREFPVATSIVSSRSSRQYSLTTFFQSTPYATFGYTQKTYSVTDHFYTPNNLAYYQPNIYHYHSTPWGVRLLPGRKKRAAEKAKARREALTAVGKTKVDIDVLPVSKISDVAANITAGFNDKIWYNDMSYKDRDDCGKRMLCELNAKFADGQPMEEDEIAIASSFGKGSELDIAEETMEFDIAAVVGKQLGFGMCERRYRRCETPVSRIMEMIRVEIGDLEKVEKELKTGETTLEDIENAIAEEKEEVGRLTAKDLLAPPPTTTTASPAFYPQIYSQIWGASSRN